ncbi:hypothetical protein [Sutcliffiella horikoshii]|uniref:hypothetical protein n=1 Tax=Sutcliffiella horikoshii TaxID=79883 RepID=UPI00384ED1F8
MEKIWLSESEIQLLSRELYLTLGQLENCLDREIRFILYDYIVLLSHTIDSQWERG